MFFATNKSAAQKLLSLTLLVSVSAAPLFSLAAPCHSQDQGHSLLSVSNDVCSAKCCAEQTSSCCGESSARRVCDCSHEQAPPAVPSQQQRSSDRGECCWAVASVTTGNLIGCSQSQSVYPDVVTSSSWPTTRLQVVLCRWLT